MTWAEIEQLFKERFDGAFFVCIGLIACFRVLAYGLTKIALSAAMVNTTGISSQYLITLYTNGTQKVLSSTGPFKELNPNAPFAPMAFIVTLVIPILVIFGAALRTKQASYRNVFYAFAISISFADFLNDALSLSSVYIHAFTSIVIISLVWVSIAFIPTVVGLVELEKALRKPPVA